MKPLLCADNVHAAELDAYIVERVKGALAVTKACALSTSSGLRT